MSINNFQFVSSVNEIFIIPCYFKKQHTDAALLEVMHYSGAGPVNLAFVRLICISIAHEQATHEDLTFSSGWASEQYSCPLPSNVEN